MKPLALNLSKMKKVEGDDKSSTFLHPDGHKMVIAHSGISSLQKKQIEKMPIQKLAEGTPDGPLEVEPVNNSPLEVEPVQDSAPAPMADDRTPASVPQYQTPMQAQESSFQEEKNANIAGARALGQQGSQEAQAYGDAADQIESLPTQSDIVNANKAKNDELFKAYASKQLDPDNYWKHHSKWGAALGMALSGMGSATAGGANGAMQVINDGISRDIDAQKNAQDQKMTLWKMNRDALGSDLAANLATQNQLYVGLKHKLEKAAAQSKGPLAMAGAQATNARIDQALAMNNFKLSLMNPTSDNPDPSSRVQFLVPPDKQAKVSEEIDAAKNTVANAPGIMEAFEQAAKEVRPMTGGTGTSGTAFVPGMKSPGQSALIARLGPTFKDVEGTVRQAAMDNMEHNVSPRFGDDDATIEQKRKSLQDYMASKSAASLSKSFGIDLSKYPATNINMIKKMNPEAKPQLSKSGRPMVQRNGKWYYQ